MRYVEAVRLTPVALGQEGDLLLAAESIAASARVACALLASAPDTERGTCRVALRGWVTAFGRFTGAVTYRDGPRAAGCYENLIRLSPEMPETLIYYACADGGGRATKQPFRNSIPMLGTKLPGGRNYRIRCRMESFVKGSRASRGVVGTFCDPSSYSGRRRRHPHNISPEPTRLLHVKLLSRELQRQPAHVQV
jgi:hypothetical protein